MKTIVVDDEVLALEQFELQCESMKEIQILKKFTSPYSAIDFAKENAIDLAVLDIEMPGLNGIELLTELRKIHPNLIAIIVTGYSKYALDAYKAHAVAYLLKPYSEEDLAFAVQTAKLLSKGQKQDIFIRTFGRFEVFINNTPVFFRSAKAKELLALMVDQKGGCITTEYGISRLWENRPYDQKTQNLYRKVAKSLNDTLKENDIEEIIINNKTSRNVNVEKFECDYYQFLDNKQAAIDRFNYEYMSDYAWGEETLASLIMRSYK